MMAFNVVFVVQQVSAFVSERARTEEAAVSNLPAPPDASEETSNIIEEPVEDSGLMNDSPVDAVEVAESPNNSPLVSLEIAELSDFNNWDPDEGRSDCNHDEYITEVIPLLERHTEAVEIGEDTSEVELQGIIDDLRQIRDETYALVDSNDCEDLQIANTYLVNSMDTTRLTFIGVMTGEPEQNIVSLMLETEFWVNAFMEHTAAWQ
jgi:hypothetical protein